MRFNIDRTDPMTQLTRPEILTVCCAAPSARGGKYRWPVSIRVGYPDLRYGGPKGYRYADRSIYRVENVDSRYDGPRSAHGQALREALAAADLAEAAVTPLGLGPEHADLANRVGRLAVARDGAGSPAGLLLEAILGGGAPMLGCVGG